ncbi:MAG TPA: hypothetical protein DD381_09305 [Lentisphaeria bacterium]|nr:MAG: hypothetical protein A2X47_13500 [Lentisphaerae bacterium GWF2_38_69]HBM16520.1 hypothetical protein [Lentisphaeria bacterium]
MKLGICPHCKEFVPVEHITEGNKEYLSKICTKCGKTRSLISNNAAQYAKKRNMMLNYEYEGCSLNCLNCNHKPPNIVFIETTNRCNMNCPICITNVPSMGFQFEPRMEYFEKLFKHYSEFEPPPPMQLFGGEPTMRDDIFDIIKLAKSFGLSVRLVTNGLKLADKDYCDKVVQSGAQILISFDGLKREMYQKLRAFPGSLDLKLKALENLSEHKKTKVVLMTVIDKNMNGDDMSWLLEYCLKNPHIIRGIYLMPLTHVWEEERLSYTPDRTTQEDVENIIDKAVGGDAQIYPVSLIRKWEHLANIFKLKNMHFLGVHPNCESFTLLISNGKNFLPFTRYLKKGILSLIDDLELLDKKLQPYTPTTISKWQKYLTIVSLVKLFFKHANLNAIVNAKGLKSVARWVSILGHIALGKKLKDIIKEKTEIRSTFKVLILPFEDNDTLESERLQECSSCFAYVDVKTNSIKSIPFCIWEKHKKVIMKDMAEVFNKEGYDKGLSRKKLEL